jgi:hypothetical protein
VLRHAGREYRFDRIVDLWNKRLHIDDMRWHARFRGGGGEAALSVVASPDRVIRLGYQNPDGSRARCLNSKLARASIRVNPSEGDSFALQTEHCAALEMLSLHEPPSHWVAHEEAV